MRSERISLIVYSPLFVVNQTLIKEKGSHCQSAVAHRPATQDSTLEQNAQTRRRKTTVKETQLHARFFWRNSATRPYGI
jgi:hypothetical protein